MPYITSDAELESVLKNGVTQGVDKALKEAFELLQDEIIRAGIPANVGGLYEAWETEITSGISKLISGELRYDPEKLELVQTDFPYGRHGSTLSGIWGAGNAPNDVRKGFAEIIFKGLAPINPRLGKAGGTQPARDAWTPFIYGLSDKLGNWLANELRSMGFVVV